MSLAPVVIAGSQQSIVSIISAAVAIERREWAAVKHGRRRQSPLFAFCRELRHHPEFGDLDAAAALEKVRLALRQSGATLETLFPHSEDPAIHFLEAWRNSELIGMFAAAVRDAESEPESISHTASAKYTRFVAICRHLQRRKGDEPIIIAQSVFGRVLSTKQQMVSLYVRQAIADGRLTLVTPGNRAKHYAGRYRYVEKLV